MAGLPLILADSEWREGQLVRALEPVRDIPVEIHTTRARTSLPAFAEAFWQRLTTLSSTVTLRSSFPEPDAPTPAPLLASDTIQQRHLCLGDLQRRRFDVLAQVLGR